MNLIPCVYACDFHWCGWIPFSELTEEAQKIYKGSHFDLLTIEELEGGIPSEEGHDGDFGSLLRECVPASLPIQIPTNDLINLMLSKFPESQNFIKDTRPRVSLEMTDLRRFHSSLLTKVL